MTTLLRALFLALLGATVVAAAMAGGCSGPFGQNTVRGSGAVARENRDVSHFSDVQLSGSGEVIIEQTGTESLTIETDDNLLPYLRTTVRDGSLHLETKRGVSIRPTQAVRYHVTVRNFTGVGISGSGDVRATGIDTDRLTASISGSGSADFAGRADDVSLQVSGSGSFDTSKLNSKNVRVSISGSGDASVNASDRLDATVSGSGSVHYTGNPSVQTHISGSGEVARR